MKRGGLSRKMSSEIGSTRPDLSKTTMGFVGTSIEANRLRKYSNPNLRYLTPRYNSGKFF
jgi:hypothetical protein